MKKYVFISLIALISLFYSCEHEALPTYSGEDQIYFAYADDSQLVNVREDSTIVKFGYDPVIKNDSTISIEVKVMGSVVDYDRPVKFILVDSTSTAKLGVDIELLADSSFVPAGKITGKIYVKVFNIPENLNDTALLASLRLVENQHFKADYDKTRDSNINSTEKIVSTQYRVWFDNGSEIPNFWAHAQYRQAFNMIFGPYSRAKFALMCQILPGCTREYFTYENPATVATVFSSRFPMGLLAGWAMGLNAYLNAYKEEHGEPLLDENGNEIKSGTTFV
ncbi:MAG: DUF4843 domain-containing protein [Prevotellaceae bacterium]|jgi:hypothetical protein|nr:DUF4843 domain-containing protein [Prevotellaceae bacterium]